MKSLMLMTAGLALMSTTVFGQTQAKKAPDRAQYVSLGPVAGFGHSWLSGMGVQNFKPSGHLGISAIYSRYEHWGFGADLTASHEGYSKNYFMNGNKYTNTVDPTYLRLTPRAYYFFGDYKSAVRPKVYLGPSVALKLAEDHYDSEVMMPTGDATTVMTGQGDVFKSFDFGADVGAGANIRLMKGTWLNLDAAYTHGFLNVTDMNNANRNLRFNASLMFGL